MRSLPQPQLQDRFGRRFAYLRLSITDVCNFRCSYCLPDGYAKGRGDDALTEDEITRLVAAFASVGTWKVRLTGGEPTLRTDFLDVVRAVARIEGVRRIAMTTNGYRLPERARSFADAGVHAINVSVDSFDASIFRSLTGHDRLREVTEGIDAAIDAFDTVKINTVLLRDVNDRALDDFCAFIEERPVTLRFIELMETAQRRDYFQRHHVSASVIERALVARGWRHEARNEGAGPAEVLAHPSSRGRIGLIAPYSPGFCASCNRLRVSARGELHLCLFGERGHPLRDLLQRDAQRPELVARIEHLLDAKAETHSLLRGDTGGRADFASIGG